MVSSPAQCRFECVTAPRIEMHQGHVKVERPWKVSFGHGHGMQRYTSASRCNGLHKHVAVTWRTANVGSMEPLRREQIFSRLIDQIGWECGRRAAWLSVSTVYPHLHNSTGCFN